MKTKKDTGIFALFIIGVLVAGGLMILWGQHNSAEQVFEVGFLHYQVEEQLVHDTDYAFTEEEQAQADELKGSALKSLERKKHAEGTYTTDTAAAVFGDFARVELPYTVYGENNPWCVVLLHGYNETPEDMAPEAAWWLKQGYQVILPALRGHGGEVEASSFGVFEQYDLYDLLCTLGKDQRAVMAHGRGVGAAAALLLAANESYPTMIHGIVADSVYSDLQTLKSEQLKKQFGLGETLVGKMLTDIVKKQLGFDLTTVSITEAAAQSPTVPKLFVCGGADGFVPPEHTQAVFAAAAGNKQLLIVPAARHRLCWAAAEEDGSYADAIRDWLPDQ